MTLYLVTGCTKYITVTPILAPPKQNGSYMLDTDVYEKQVRWVLMQEQTEEQAKPVGYWSRSLNKVEKVYDKTHKEGFMRVLAVFLLRTYLEGSQLTIAADYSELW